MWELLQAKVGFFLRFINAYLILIFNIKGKLFKDFLINKKINKHFRFAS